MKIGEVIEVRSDGSIIYNSYKGVINVDNQQELEEVLREEDSFFSNYR